MAPVLVTSTDEAFPPPAPLPPMPTAAEAPPTDNPPEPAKPPLPPMATAPAKLPVETPIATLKPPLPPPPPPPIDCTSMP